MNCPLALPLLLLLALPQLARADAFDRLDGDALAKLDALKARDRLTFADLEALPAALPDDRGPFLVVKTGRGNRAAMLVTPGFRKPEQGDAPAIPVLVIERFATFEPGKSGSRVAKGRNLLLFDGFHLDLDTGQVVPPGQGGDLTFRAPEPKADPALVPVAPALLQSLSGPLPTPATAAAPSSDKAVKPSDFQGRYRLRADGRFSGLLELEVAEDRQIRGRFRSEANGTVYPLNGQVSAESLQKATFTIKFPRTEQEYDAYLWTVGKNVLSGSFTMEGRPYGFTATREGSSPFAPDAP